MPRQLEEEVIRLIERALNNQVSLDEATNFLLNFEQVRDRTLEEAWHAVMHFLTDTDIRDKDLDYDGYTRADLRSRVEAIKARKGVAGDNN